VNSGIHDLQQRPSAATARQEVSISKWVNERAPPWDDILTAHDVARLTRQHPWHLSALMWIGRFPAQQRFRGRRLGWLRSDVVSWLAKELRTRNHQHGRGVQQRLPLQDFGYRRSRRIRSQRTRTGHRLQRPADSFARPHARNRQDRS
jgi:predicted DNA-binding transcriptional regulator AlpA